MAGSFNRWRASPSFDGRKSFDSSDNDEEVIIIDSSDSSLDISIDITPKKLPSSKKSSISERAIKHSMEHICISQDSDNDNKLEFVSLNGSKRNRTNDSTSNDETEEDLVEGRIQAEEMNKSWCIMQDNFNRLEDACSSTPCNVSNGDKNIQDHIDNASTSMYASTEKTEDEQRTFPMGFNVEMAISRARQEIGDGNMDPMIVQNTALQLCKLVTQFLDSLHKTMLLLPAGNTDLLPDKGDELRKRVAVLNKKIEDITAELGRTPLTEPVTTELHSVTEFNTENFDPYSNIDNVSMEPHASPNVKEFGVKAPATLEKQEALIVFRLQDLDRSLAHRPSKDVKAEDPQGLTVKLVPHQQHALAWLMWREEQNPPVGILANGTGLGNTLTMISLILATIAKKKSKGTMDYESDEEWADSKTPLRHKGGTLVVCPTSLLFKWKNEINNRCKPGMLSILVYHGRMGRMKEREIAEYDVVITTYGKLLAELKKKSIVHKIHWERVTLDKADKILEFQTQTSESVRGLIAHKRWALIDTPIQNNAINVYSILKFFRFSPFDDLEVWVRWVGNSTTEGSNQRLATLMTALMLRRTKEELEVQGELEGLPEKCVEETGRNRFV